MKFHIAFALLVVFGAAQAGKKHDVMTWGTGYKDTDDEGYGSEEGVGYDQTAATSSAIMEASSEHTEQAREFYGTKAESHYSISELFQELVREKRQNAVEFHKRAENEAVEANEAYKKAQLYKRQAKDKQAIAKDYEERAQKHDRASKEQEIKEMDHYRKSEAEMKEHGMSLTRANRHAVMGSAFQELGHMELEMTNECEQQAKELYSRAEEYQKLAQEYKEKAKKDKEQARIQEAKAKEEESKAEEYENAFIESSKKVMTLKFYEHEFRTKAENEHYMASYAQIRSVYLGRLANAYAEQAESAHRFSQLEKKDGESFNKNAIELYKESKVLTATAAHLMKQHRYTGHQAYSKKAFPHSNYHGA